MLLPSEFRDLVSGRRRGLTASSLRLLLGLAEVPYTAVVRRRNRCFDSGAAAVHHPGVPVVSVGNLTLGGTGKTPMVRWIGEWFRRRNVRLAIISRGYGRKGGAQNDEALELARQLPNVPHLQDPDRAAAARQAVEQLASQLIVLDDGFQHRRIARDLDVVLLDASEPFGHGHVFPRGTLREPVEGLGRADVVVLSRSEMLQPADREAIRQEACRHAPDALWVEMAYGPIGLRASDGEELDVQSLRGEPVAAFCGIGNPAAFRHTLECCGYLLTDFREFADHHRFNQKDVESLDHWAAGLDVAAVLCTHKDLVKLDVKQLGRHPLRALLIGLDFLTGRAALEQRLSDLLPGGGTGNEGVE